MGPEDKINSEGILESECIQAAMTKHQITRRAKLRLPGGEVTYPTHMTIAAQKRTLLQ